MITMIMFSINNAQQNKPLIFVSEVRNVPDIQIAHYSFLNRIKYKNIQIYEKRQNSYSSRRN